MHTSRLSTVASIGVGLALVAACGKVEDNTAVDAPSIDAVATHALTTTRSGNGSGTVTSTPAGIDCGSDCTEAFPDGTVVTLRAVASASSSFLGWASAGCSGTGDCVVTLAADQTVDAQFALGNSVVVTLAGNGVGTVTSAPAGINCPGDCSEAFGPGQTVTLTATPGAASTFTGWTGGGCTGTGPCTVSTDVAVGIVATFALEQHAITVTKAGNGAGTVTSNPAGINCGATCSASYDTGATVTLVAAAAVGSTFTGWSGACSGTGTCDVTVTAAASVTATFALNQFTLTVSKAGTGAGTVTSAPAGINCGAACAANFNFGTSVTLTAAPAAGSTFAGWSGGGCSGTSTCVLPISAATTVTATFTLSQHTLTVTKAGNGAGTVTSSPAGVNCGADCSEAYAFGTNVVLTATPAAGSVFTGWSGACTGTSTCTVAMTAARAATATFTLSQFTLTVTKAGTGAGTVTSAPAGINCGADCTEAYNNGTSVVLTATPTGTATFAGWSGACTGTGTCTVAMTAARAVTATFTAGTTALSCTSITTAATCTNGAIAEINLGALNATACRSQCQTSMGAAGMTAGCWIIASNSNCYCRNGTLNLGGGQPGGVCN